MVQIERLRAMANQAVAEYQSALAAGGEPSYPEWADDILAVCDQAEAGQQFVNHVGAQVINLQAARHHTMQVAARR